MDTFYFIPKNHKSVIPEKLLSRKIVNLTVAVIPCFPKFTFCLKTLTFIVNKCVLCVVQSALTPDHPMNEGCLQHPVLGSTAQLLQTSPQVHRPERHHIATSKPITAKGNGKNHDCHSTTRTCPVGLWPASSKAQGEQRKVGL